MQAHSLRAFAALVLAAAFTAGCEAALGPGAEEPVELGPPQGWAPQAGPEPAIAMALGKLQAEHNRAGVAAAIQRADQRRGAVLAALDAHALPHSFAAIPIVESRYRNLGEPGVHGPSFAPGAGGAGVWMFIPTTARRYGLRVDGAMDERLDEAREMDAAMRLLADLMTEFQDPGLALAGYNQGQGHVRRAIARQGTRDPWELMRRGAINTYAADVLAAARALEDPTLVGAPPRSL